jgi:hypothetical protein
MIRFFEAFCAGIGALTLFVLGTAFLTSTYFQLGAVAPLLAISMSAAYATVRVLKPAPVDPQQPRTRTVLLTVTAFVAAGVGLLATSTSPNSKYSDTTIVFDQNLRDQTQLFEAFLALHKYLLSQGFLQSPGAPSPFGFQSGVITSGMTTFSYLDKPNGHLRLRVDVHPKDLHLTCYSEPFGARRSIYEEASRGATDFSAKLKREDRVFSFNSRSSIPHNAQHNAAVMIAADESIGFGYRSAYGLE